MGSEIEEFKDAIERCKMDTQECDDKRRKLMLKAKLQHLSAVLEQKRRQVNAGDRNSRNL